MELNLTQTAISHRIKSLETLTGTRLFVRDGGAVRLTRQGREYLDAVRSAIVAISMATSRMIDRQNVNSLAIMTHVKFGLKTLIPLLGEFRALHPQINLRLSTTSSFDMLQRHDYDVAVRYGTGDWSGMHSTALGQDESYPICSPAFQTENALVHPRDLANCTIIRTTSQILGDDWPQWLDAAGVGDLVIEDEIICDYLYVSVEAALNGLGVAMARSSVVVEDLAAGTLVRPFDIRIQLSSGYHVVSPDEAVERPAVRLFRNWLVAKLGRPGSVSEKAASALK